jgi:hypothetical protein
MDAMLFINSNVGLASCVTEAVNAVHKLIWFQVQANEVSRKISLILAWLEDAQDLIEFPHLPTQMLGELAYLDTKYSSATIVVLFYLMLT